MDHIPSLDDLLSYGDDYPYPDLIMSDYFEIDQNKKMSQEQSLEEEKEEQSQGRSSEEEKEGQSQEQSSEEEKEEQFQGRSSEEEKEEQSQEQSSEEEKEEQSQGQSSEEEKEGQSQGRSSEEEKEGQSQGQSSEEEKEEQSQEQSSEEEKEGQSQGRSSEEEKEEQSQEQSSEEEKEEQSQEQIDVSSQEQSDENDFDNLMNNYDEDNNMSHQLNESYSSENPSDKLNDITTTKIYQVLKRLVSLSYERYEKGSYKYDKKAMVRHYLTSQKFRIMDDLMSPTFKPDVYVFDLSPSNNEYLEMYVNAISSVAIKNSIIYLTYNDRILRKLTITKENTKGIDVGKVATSQIQKYANFDCIIFNEYQSLYDELREIKDRKIYIFSDFDISLDISKLSQENQEIVWFSTEQRHHASSFCSSFLYPFVGYYVETSRIEDIEKFVLEKNKSKYKRGLYDGR